MKGRASFSFLPDVPDPTPADTRGEITFPRRWFAALGYDTRTGERFKGRGEMTPEETIEILNFLVKYATTRDVREEDLPESAAGYRAAWEIAQEYDRLYHSYNRECMRKALAKAKNPETRERVKADMMRHLPPEYIPEGLTEEEE